MARGLAAAMTGYLICDMFSGYILSAHLYVLFGLAASAHRIAQAYAVKETARDVKQTVVPGWEGSNHAA
ncbi:hypothetical protein ACN28S_33995 [Cystobacter fuscus]